MNLLIQKSLKCTTDVLDTYLASTTFDLAAVPNRLLAITTDTSLMANDFISHSSPPRTVKLFDLDFSSDLLNLVFDEPIDINTLNFNEITIQSGSTKYTLTNGSVIDMIVDDQVTLYTSNVDVVVLKSKHCN